MCLRCDRLRNSGQFTCGRCGDMYWIKPIVGTPAHGSSDQNDAAGTSHSHSKKKKAALEPNWNIPSEPGSLTPLCTCTLHTVTLKQVGDIDLMGSGQVMCIPC